MEATQISGVRDYLELMVNMRKQFNNSPDLKFKCFEDFVLSFGQHFPEYLARPKWVKRGVIKQCFSNCFDEMLKNPNKLLYCEGYATGVIPVHHAWLITLDGKVIDPTWHGRSIVKDSTEYFGVTFKTEYVLKVAAETGYYGVIDNFSQNYPLLTGEHKPEDFLIN